ncbi:MAG: dihydrofolate reductase [Bacilli bacterium]|nr:dihydrofolate reductase [Bacilli bacterium]
MKNLSLIAAIGRNLELGYQNDLIWKIKEDLHFFKEKTMGSYIIMGRKTYESLPQKLQGRKYIVLTNDVNIISNDSLTVFRNVKDVLEFVKNNPDSYFYVIGGGQIYKAFSPYVDSMYLTEINASFEQADTFFPAFDKNDWIENADQLLEENGIKYRHILYLRKKN